MRYVEHARDNLRSHFVFRPRHAPEWLRPRFLPVVFLANEEELTRKTFTRSLNTTNPNTYVKIIFLRTSPLRKTERKMNTLRSERRNSKCSLVLWDQLASGLVYSAWNWQKMVHAFSKIYLGHELILLYFAPSKRLQTCSWLASAYNSTSMAFSKERCPDDKDLQLAILI